MYVYTGNRKFSKIAEMAQCYRIRAVKYMIVHVHVDTCIRKGPLGTFKFKSDLCFLHSHL